MLITPAFTAPPYSVLRSMHGEPTTPTFPVYQHLVESLLDANDPDATVRHVLAVGAGYAYSDAGTVATMMARLGLDRIRCVMVSQSVDAMFIRSTAYILQSTDRRLVIICYRGTEPVNLVNWLTDADVNPTWVPFQFPLGPDPDSGVHAPDGTPAVHAGFYRNVRATRYAVMGVLRRALVGKSIAAEDDSPGTPMQTLYITGHSLGAAMAAMMAVMIKTNSSYSELADKLKAVYTYGQPMIGDPDFAALCSHARFGGTQFLADKLFRYIYAHDVVPQLPPTETGPFRHFGREFRCDALPTTPAAPRPEWTEAPHPTRQTNLVGLSIGAAALFTAQVARLRGLPLQQSIVDHGPQNYIAALTPKGVRSEFGD